MFGLMVHPKILTVVKDLATVADEVEKEKDRERS
jgi:hypothetical protein